MAHAEVRQATGGVWRMGAGSGRRLFVTLLSCMFAIPADAQVHTADVVVYGGTSAGVIAAVQAVRMGKTAVVVEPGQHLGGLTASGLGWTDSGNKAAIGGLSREFYQRVKQHYEGRRVDFRTADPAAHDSGVPPRTS